MSIEVKQEDLLPEINASQMSIDADKLLSMMGGCVSFGPFKLCANVELLPPSAKVTMSYNGNEVAVCQLDASHTECNAKYGNSNAKIDVTVKLDIPGKKITATGKACVHVPVIGWKCMSHTVTVYSW